MFFMPDMKISECRFHSSLLNNTIHFMFTCKFHILFFRDTTIRLYLDEFMTECNWDFLHFHDGLSPFDQTLGVYGLVLDKFAN